MVLSGWLTTWLRLISGTRSMVNADGQRSTDLTRLGGLDMGRVGLVWAGPDICRSARLSTWWTRTPTGLVHGCRCTVDGGSALHGHGAWFTVDRVHPSFSILELTVYQALVVAARGAHALAHALPCV